MSLWGLENHTTMDPVLQETIIPVVKYDIYYI
jgi:hypothetical protein